MNVTILQFIFFGLAFLAAIFCLIGLIRKDDGIDYDKWIKIYKHEKETSLSLINDGNKEIDRIESEILKCKKKLKMKLFEK